MKRLAGLAVFVMVVAACGGVATVDTTKPTAPPTTAASTEQAPTPTAGSETTSTTGDTPAATEAPAGPLAPDFSLALSDGSTFTLSAEQKPVYLIFWAEW